MEFMGQDWTGWDEGLAVNEALFHFPAGWAAKLRKTGLQGLDSASGFIEFCCEMVEFGTTRSLRTLKELDSVEPLLKLGTLLDGAVNAPPDGLNLGKPTPEYLADIRARLQQVDWLPRLEQIRGGALLRHHAFIRGWDGVYAVLATLLMDPKNRGLLMQCGYPPCSKFFIAERSGQGRPSGYCLPEHRELDQSPRKQRQRAARLLGKYPAKATVAAVHRAMREHPEVTQAEQLAKYAEAHLRHTRKRK
jgi:hypothetical protein